LRLNTSLMSEANPSTPDARSVAVYCGSSPGNQPAFKHAAQSLGKALVRSGLGLVYGGGSKGIMGFVSDTVLSEGGRAVGVIPSAMVRAGGEGKNASPDAVPQSKSGYSETLSKMQREGLEVVVTPSMHARKVEMASRSSAFIGLPGGYGTFEEVMEVVTWTQLRIHTKPVLVLNVRNYFSPLRELVRNGIEAGFIPEANAALLVVVNGPDDLALHDTFDWGSAAIKALEEWKPPVWAGYGFKWEQETKNPLD